MARQREFDRSGTAPSTGALRVIKPGCSELWAPRAAVAGGLIHSGSISVRSQVDGARAGLNVRAMRLSPMAGRFPNVP
jgi:hypothetical protein